MEKIILQIIPAPANMYARYEDEEESFELPIVCLALVEEGDYRSIEPMDILDNGNIDSIYAAKFKQIVFR